jgi:hypothetical protein
MGVSTRAGRCLSRPARLGALSAALIVALAGCGVTTPTPTPPPLPPSTGVVVGVSTAPLERVEIYYPIAYSWLAVGSTFSFGVFAVHTDGVYEQVSTPRGVTWASSDPAIVAVSSPTTGTLRAVSPGIATLTASYQGRSASVTQEIRAGEPPYPFLEIWPTAAPSRQYMTRDARARRRESNTSFPDVTAAATWTSSDPRVATVDGGVVLATGVGTTRITASHGGMTASYVFSVYESYPR